MTSTFGSYIVARRKELGISQKDLAGRVLKEEDNKPITPQYLNDIERDRRQPTSDHIIRQLAKALEVEADYLFYLSGTLPADVREANIPREDVVQMFSAFRRTAR
ncbi:XRE family transcriptional regulator [Methylobacterium sp. Leaf456]|uniref:helix-turn-helix domain-containing protein n=1 Tax=Methylobacterium sp. Leaf456 TaxID=1736382 RepID=UPI0006FD92F1|nr:helix-turn-helix transcriptional regulator [Methylobacterium sp. Leaf456]KQT50586.1 XRE family transcriptional regulator [Methylobacterium sp. Leaf456]